MHLHLSHLSTSAIAKKRNDKRAGTVFEREKGLCKLYSSKARSLIRSIQDILKPQMARLGA
jgi:hypothetical protein